MIRRPLSSYWAPSLVAVRLRAAVVGASIAPLLLVAPVQAQEVQQNADPLIKAVEDFWHYGKVARYDLAVAKAADITAAAGNPIKVLEAFEKVAGDRSDDLNEWVIRWQGTPETKDVANQIAEIINKGRFERRGKPEFIQSNIERLSTNARAYGLAMVQLRESGELAVPLMLDVLKDPARQAQHGAIRRAIVDLGRYAVNPLVAATETKDQQQLEVVISLLGNLGYDSAVPYLVRITEAGPSDTIKTVAARALEQLRYSGSNTSADLFYELSEKLYYDKSSLTADLRFPTANVWRVDGDKGLLRTPVPPAIFNEIMSMRAAEYALALNTPQDALSLWLAANYKREAELPAGEKDATRADAQPNAHYYGVTAGAKYLNATLARALHDRNNPVALAAVKSLQEIAGDSNFKSGDTQSIIDAMQYGDRRVRFEAAFTVAQALPQSAFNGQELVVPLLAEAISQTGTPSVLAVLPTQEAVNAIVDALKRQGFVVTGATSAAGALSASASLPAIDVVLISDELQPAEIETLLGLIAQSPKIRAAGKLFIVKSNASQWETRKVTDPTISTTMSSDPSALKDVLTAAREASGALPLDPALATQYATRAGELIKRLAISRGQILDLTPARSTLLGALEDARPEIIKLAGEGLALLNSDDAQKGILLKATTDATADDVKVSLFKSTSVSAKFWGNKLDAAQIEALDHVVKDATNPDVKSAAAEARGALNLPSDQAKTLIVEQSRR